MEESKTQTAWPTSRQTFKQALSIAQTGWKPLLLVLISQMIVYTLANYWVAFYTYGWLSEIAGALFLFLYNSFRFVALIRLFNQPGSSISSIFGIGTFKRLLPAFALVLFLTIVISLASFLLIIPGVLLMIWWSFSLYILVLEERSIKDSLKRSYQLIRGMGWHILGRYLFALFLMTIITAFLIIPASGYTVFLFGSVILSALFVFYLGLTYQQVVSLRSRQVALPSLSIGKKVGYVALAILLTLLFVTFSSLGSFVVSVSQGAI